MNQLFTSVLLLFFSAALFAQVNDTAFVTEITRYREHYKQEFLADTRSPLHTADTALLDFFGADSGWRVIAGFIPETNAEPFDMPTYSGRKKRFVKYGIAYFTKSDTTYYLHLYQNLALAQQETYKDYLFLPFKDETNGETTYGGGRYLDFRTADVAADNTLILDFNKAYNPWCAYSDGYNCPIPPVENHLKLAVEAGEKNFKGEKKH